MPNPRVQALIDAFRSHFREEGGERIPLALRQDPVDVVFTSLVEEDRPPAADASMMGDFGLAPLPPMGGDMGMPMPLEAPQMPQDALGDLLGTMTPDLGTEEPTDPLAGLMG